MVTQSEHSRDQAPMRGELIAHALQRGWQVDLLNKAAAKSASNLINALRQAWRRHEVSNPDAEFMISAWNTATTTAKDGWMNWMGELDDPRVAPWFEILRRTSSRVSTWNSRWQTRQHRR